VGPSVAVLRSLLHGSYTEDLGDTGVPHRLASGLLGPDILNPLIKGREFTHSRERYLDLSVWFHHRGTSDT
jgi:hypothetical protein